MGLTQIVSQPIDNIEVVYMQLDKVDDMVNMVNRMINYCTLTSVNRKIDNIEYHPNFFHVCTFVLCRPSDLSSSNIQMRQKGPLCYVATQQEGKQERK